MIKCRAKWFDNCKVMNTLILLSGPLYKVVWVVHRARTPPWSGDLICIQGRIHLYTSYSKLPAEGRKGRGFRNQFWEAWGTWLRKEHPFLVHRGILWVNGGPDVVGIHPWWGRMIKVLMTWQLLKHKMCEAQGKQQDWPTYWLHLTFTQWTEPTQMVNYSCDKYQREKNTGSPTPACRVKNALVKVRPENV